MSTNVTLEGRLGGDPEIRFTQGGKAVASFSMVTSKSRKQDNGEWLESETTWYRVSAWDALGENVVESLRKGDAVIVTGRQYMDEYVDKNGEKRQSLKVEAYNVGPSLKRAQWGRKETAGMPSSAPAVAADPWSTGGDDIPPF